MRTRSALIAGLVLLHAVMLAARFGVTRSFLAGDSAWYFALTRSLYVDRDVDLANEARFFYDERSPYSGNRKLLMVPEPVAATGKVAWPGPAGISLVLLPAYAVADGLNHAFSAGGIEVDRTGYRGLYQVAPALFSAAIGWAGLLLFARSTARLCGARRALETTAIVWLATPVIYYLTIEPLMAHGVAIGLACTVVALSLDAEADATAGRVAAIGAASGLLAITRYQDTLFLLVPLLTLKWKPATLAIFVAALAPLVAIEMAINAARFGSPFVIGYGWAAATGGRSIADVLSRPPAIATSLFDPRHGAFTVHPIHLLGIAGLVLFPLVRKRMALALGVVFLGELYLVSALYGVTPGVSFGNRLMTSLTPASVLGWQGLVTRYPKLRAGGCLLAAVNLLLLVLYCAGLLARRSG